MAHGYAITGHKAQGLTVDHTFVLATEATYRKWGYVALSRGRHSNRLYTHEHDDLDIDGGPHTREPHRDPIATTVTRLSRSRAEQPVSEVPGVRLARLADWLGSEDVRRARQVHRDHDQTARDRQATAHRHTRAEQDLERHRGLAVTRRARAERSAAEQRASRLAKRLVEADQRLADLDAQLASLPGLDEVHAALDEYRQTHQQLDRHVARRVATVTHEPPDYLLAHLGRPPDEPTSRNRWQQAAHTIESYRSRWHITHPTAPLGDPPEAPDQQHDHHRTVRDLDRGLHPPERTRDLGHGLAR